MVTRKTVFHRILPACALALVLIFNVVLVSVLLRFDDVEVSARDVNSYVTVDEIYNNPANVQHLYDLIYEKKNAKYNQICVRAELAVDAGDFRSKNYAKIINQYIQVKFGGLAWQVCYLTLTGKEGDPNRTPILTLLLADTNVLSTFQTWQTIDDFDATYPANLYGTSYLRAVTLNNGGQYAVGPHGLTTATQNKNNPFAIFTMDGIEGSVTDAIVKPSQVGWQETQSAIAAGISEYNYFNEAWGTPSNNTLDTATKVDFRTKDLSDAWKNDYLWLPSYTEIGIGGLWKLGPMQAICGKQYWLRTVNQNDTYGVGQITEYGEFTYGIVNNGGYYVLPALHLNLASPALRAASTPLGQL